MTLKDVQIPSDVMAAATRLENWAKQSGLEQWALGGLCSRDKYERLSAKYQELMMAVIRKYEGESRHDTALRYIREAEHRMDNWEKTGPYDKA